MFAGVEPPSGDLPQGGAVEGGRWTETEIRVQQLEQRYLALGSVACLERAVIGVQVGEPDGSGVSLSSSSAALTASRATAWVMREPPRGKAISTCEDGSDAAGSSASECVVSSR
jgi:hypothetical protein